MRLSLAPMRAWFSPMRVSLSLLILAAVGLGVGVGWWVHPGAGLALGSITLGSIALFRDDGTNPQRGRSR